MKLASRDTYFPVVMFPNKSIPATEKEKNTRNRIIPILPSDDRESQRAFRRFFRPFDVFIILSNLAALMILSTVTLNEKMLSSKATNDNARIVKSNLFQFSKK